MENDCHQFPQFKMMSAHYLFWSISSSNARDIKFEVI